MSDRIENLRKAMDSKNQRYFRNIRYPEIPKSPNDLYVQTSLGDRVDLLSHKYYNDVDLWWVIIHANPGILRRDSYTLKPGLIIRIPQNIHNLYTALENLNK